MSRTVQWKLIALVLGLAALVWFVSQAEWGAVLDSFRTLGWNVVWMLFPYLVVYGFDNLGWYMTLTRSIRGKISYLEAFWIRWLGESVNNLLPTAYIGGEAVKAMMIQRRGGSITEATTAAVVSKTTQTVAEVLFIALATYLARGFLDLDSPFRKAMWWVTALAGLVAVGLFAVQFLSLLRMFAQWAQRRAGKWFRALSQIWEHAIRLDHELGAFYRKRQLDTWLSVMSFFLGWVCGSLEILAMAYLLDVDISWQQAMALEAFIGVAKGLGIFVPGAIGVQESGIVFLCRAFALPDGFGPAYAMVRRARELLYAGIGVFFLGKTPRQLFGKGVNVDQAPDPKI